MTEETYLINVEIDKNMNAQIRLKKNMSALEFHGLMIKAKGLFNISNKELVTSEPSNEEVLNNIPNGPVLSKPRKRKLTTWTPEMLQFLKDNYGRIPTVQLVKNPTLKGVSIASLYNHASEMKLTNKMR